MSENGNTEPRQPSPKCPYCNSQPFSFGDFSFGETIVWCAACEAILHTQILGQRPAIQMPDLNTQYGKLIRM